MNTDKAIYCIALVVLALGLTSEYRQGNFATMHLVAGRAEYALCGISTRAEQLLAASRSIPGLRDRFAVDGLVASARAAEMARNQEEMVREQARDQVELIRDQVQTEVLAQADEIRAQAEVRRAEIERIGDQAISEFDSTRVSRRVAICSKSATRIVIDGEPVKMSSDASARVKVDSSF